jgi:hypothetical protein
MRVTFIPYTRRIYFHTFPDGIGLRVSLPSRPDVAASYAIPVRRVRTLLTASFGFRVAPDTLVVRLSVPTIRVRRGLSPPSHCLATTTKQMALTRHAPCLAHNERAGLPPAPWLLIDSQCHVIYIAIGTFQKQAYHIAVFQF